ncbi:TolC family protein [Roseateles oligotrophus]|uniref:TolC family protein n=1 Tax=Roseateles oligotrophus TaxID=1769250 RepID=A0ABT2YD11_9BURK|nr:TolC family protein [Roseateles oligotrophus]MCV2367938.1 TolC family protein [Roseateles oligotrophus]
MTAMTVLAGCSTALPPPAPVSDLPATWSAGPAQTEGSASVGWLAPELTALQTQALAANRDIAQAALRWQQAQRQAAQADLRLQPSLSLNYGSSRPLEHSTPGWRSNAGLSAGLGYEVDLWGRLAHANAAQLAQAESARTDIAAAKALILAQVAERYWTQAAIAAQQPLATEQARHSQEALEITGLRVREGKMLPIEVDKAAATLQSAQLRLSDLKADAQLQSNQLALLLDQAPPGPILSQAQLPGMEPPPWRLAAPAEVLAQRPDVQRARLAVDAALARLHGAQAERYPRLSFSASLSSGGSEWRDWLSQPLASLAANLTVPLVDWRRLELQQASAHTELELAALSLRETLFKSLAEVEAQMIERERLRQQFLATELRLREARQAEALAELRMQVGSIARIDWLQARDARLNVEVDLLQLQLRRWLNHAGMFRVLGLELWSGGTL